MCPDAEHLQELKPGTAGSGQPASDFPCDLPIPNQAQVTTTLAPVRIELFADVFGCGEIVISFS